MTTELNLDPSDILIGDNVRFSLKPDRISRLADQIIADGGVHTPVTVEKLKDPIDGKAYRLVFGHIRTAAIEKLNKEQSAGLSIPARVIGELTPAERLKLQVSENNERENMSYMDKAVAIRRMLDNGLSKMDVRNAFAAPGGRKGNKIQPASNSHINMLLSFLDFPKDIQRKIHDGLIGTGAAYELAKYPKDKWEPILEKAEASRIKEVERDEKDEETFLAQTKKLTETEQEQEKVNKSLEAAKLEAAEAEALAKTKADAVAEALKERLAARSKTKEEKDKANEHYKAMENDWKAAQSVADQKTKEANKLGEKAATATEKATAARERLEAARKAKTAKKEAVQGKDVKKAAKKEGATAKGDKEPKPVKLNASEMRECIKELTINGKTKTKAVGILLVDAFDGKITDGQLRIGIARLLGEEPMPAATPAPKK